MSSHLLPNERFDYNSYYIPPDKYLQLPAPDETWYRSETDPIAHDRPLHLTRGIHLLNEWWKSQDLEIFHHVAANAFYLIEGMPGLETNVRMLHQMLNPQQDLRGRSIVFGTGATQIINAALFATALYHSMQTNPVIDHKVLCSTLFVTEQLPSYLEDNTLVHILHKNLLAWIPFEEHESVVPEHLLEFITTPNNPDGSIRKKMTKSRYTIHDRVNHWSCLLHADDRNIREETLENDAISIFSLSKFLSFSSSRVGYAFVKDPQIAHFMRYYIVISTHGLVYDSQYRCYMALQYLLEENGMLDDYTGWIRKNLEQRWQRLRKTMENTPLDLLNFQGPTAWIKTPEPAADYLKTKYRILATYGEEYGAGNDHVRFNMLATSNQFEELIWRLQHL